MGNDRSEYDISSELQAATEALSKDASYNYVIFDDNDVEITDVLRASADNFDDKTRQDLIDYTALNILSGESYKDTIEHLERVTKNVLDANEIKHIHAQAVAAIKGERAFAGMTVNKCRTWL